MMSRFRNLSIVPVLDSNDFSDLLVFPMCTKRDISNTNRPINPIMIAAAVIIYASSSPRTFVVW